MILVQKNQQKKLKKLLFSNVELLKKIKDTNDLLNVVKEDANLYNQIKSNLESVISSIEQNKQNKDFLAAIYTTASNIELKLIKPDNILLLDYIDNADFLPKIKKAILNNLKILANSPSNKPGKKAYTVVDMASRNVEDILPADSKEKNKIDKYSEKYPYIRQNVVDYLE